LEHGEFQALYNFGETYVAFETPYKEALEFWAVSDFLYSKLENKGEIVGELLDFKVWGRSCSGQAVHMDTVIKKISIEIKA